MCIECAQVRDLADDGTERCVLCLRLNAGTDTPGGVADMETLRRMGAL